MLGRPIQLVVAAALAFGVAAVAQALELEPTWKSLEARSTVVSGYGGNLEVLELGTATNHAVYGIGSREVWNRPCELFVWARNLDSNSDVDDSGEYAGRCSSTGSVKTASFVSNPRYFVRGVAICTSKTAGHPKRMKGWRVVAAKVWQTKREIDALATTETFTRSNCDGDWHDTVYCDEGYVASGVNVYWDRDEDAIVGLGLRCRYVAWLG